MPRAEFQAKHATFRFYAELNDFLSPTRRFQSFCRSFKLSSSVKDMIESMGVPHTEVELILVNGTPVDFTRMLNDGDRVSVYPAFTTLDIGSVPQLRPPLQEHRFVLDTHLGRLARYLRLQGFDSVYQNNAEDKELARMSHDEQRILFTRDCGLLKRTEVVYGYYVRSTEIREQLHEVLKRFHLIAAAVPFSRCLNCNAVLRRVSKESVLERLEPRTRQHFNEFRECTTCNRIYWAGSHHERMSEFLRSVWDDSDYRNQAL